MPETKRIRIHHLKMDHEIQQTIFCDAKYTIYLAECHLCNKQYVGSTVDFKQRMAKYKRNIRTCPFFFSFLGFYQ